MDCREAEERDLAEAYVAGRLDAAERESFEQHYFECDACLARVEACILLRRGLSERPVGGGRIMRGLSAARWPLATAAVALLTVGAWWVLRTSAPAPDGRTPVGVSPTPETASPLAELGRFDPPTYRATTWRGGSTQAQRSLETGMRRYAAHDYRGAVAGLRRAAALSPAAAETQFYLGVSLLLTRDVDSGIASLERASALGDTPYLESTLFYLAKGYLLKGDRPRAEQSLGRMVALGGDLEPAGRELLRRLKGAESRP
jgi:tetratricopeptide (TPR) repeat protein